jgi:hypothetical protein
MRRFVIGIAVFFIAVAFAGVAGTVAAAPPVVANACSVGNGDHARDSAIGALRGLIATRVDCQNVLLQSLVSGFGQLAETYPDLESIATAGPALNELQAGVLQLDQVVISEEISSKLLDSASDSLDADIVIWEEKLDAIGDDAQLANVDLQNILQKQQQTLQMMSNISKMLYDTAQAVIRKPGG